MEKAGMSTLAKVGIGCAVVLLIAVIGVGVTGYWAVGKAKKFAEEAEKNPALATAKLLAMANPDIEIVSSDDDAQTVTLKNLKTQEVVTLNLDEIQDGKFSWETKDGKGQISASEDGLKMEGPDGEMTIGDSNQKLPDWVPNYANGETTVTSTYDTLEVVGGIASISSSETVEEFGANYKAMLEGNGFVMKTSNTMTSDDGTVVMMTAEREEFKQSIYLQAGTQEGKTQAHVTFAQSKK